MADLTKPILNTLAAVREKRGIAASTLAAMAGVSRQTIYAVESGSYIPNTAVALRLARALEVSVDDLFALADQPAAPEPRLEKVSLLPPGHELYPGQGVQLCEVEGKLLAAGSLMDTCFLPPSDGVIHGHGAVRGKVSVEVHESEEERGTRLLLAGCDPALSLLARFLEPAGVKVILVHQNSLQSLTLLKRGLAHLAGTHLREEASGGANLGAVARLFPNESAAVVSFASGEEGLLAAHGNPLKIRGVEDLARSDVSFVNRETGSGSRALLDSRLKTLGLNGKSIHGYEQLVPGHLAAARAIHEGAADCCLATQAAAQVYGLHFIPLESVRFDLVLRKEHLEMPAIQLLFDSLNRAEFRWKLRNAGGYDTAVTGERQL